MTEEQKGVVCDIYCKYRDRADQIVKASLAHPDNKALVWMREGAEQILEKKCSVCILNEAKTDETLMPKGGKE